jgi:DNA topoisomerase-1
MPITAGLGRFGPFVRHDKTYASLEEGDEVFDVGLNRAVTLIAEKVAKGPSKRFGADPGKALGDHPTLGAVAVKSGRYGVYVTAGGVNATIPSDKEKDTITLPEAIALIDERAAKGGGKVKKKAAKPAKKASAKKPAKAAKSAATDEDDGEDDTPKPAKKAAAKKTAAKKAAAKPKADSTSKARAPVAIASKTSAAKTSAAKPAAKAPAKKSAGKARG